jgi:ATP-dependent helicase/nuclease subunit B
MPNDGSMRPFAKGDSHWFSIPAHRPFLDDLAKGLFAAITPDGPDALSDAVILVPNRRAARALSQAFVATAGGKALLLPQIRALGDLDEGEPPFEPGDLALDLPPAISPWRRRFELARLAGTYAPRLGRELDAAAALELGDALGAFFDSLEIEEVGDRDRIESLVEGDLAEHWQVSATRMAQAPGDPGPSRCHRASRRTSQASGSKVPRESAPRSRRRRRLDRQRAGDRATADRHRWAGKRLRRATRSR